MILGPIIDHIKAGSLGFKTVDGVEAVADLDTLIGALPGCFVIPGTETNAGGQEGAGLIMLEIRASFSVAIIVQAAATRGKVRDELTGFADAVTARLLGWTWDPAFRPFVPTQARLLGIAAGRASWIAEFRTTYYLRKQG